MWAAIIVACLSGQCKGYAGPLFKTQAQCEQSVVSEGLPYFQRQAPAAELRWVCAQVPDPA